MTQTTQELYIRRILDTYGDSLFRCAYSYVKNEADAQEIVQDTLIQLLHYDPDFENQEKEKAWLMKTTANLSRNRIRDNAKHIADELDERLAVEEKEDLSFLWQAVKQLSLTQQEVIHLFYQEGYTTKEMSEILDRNENTVRSDLKRARERLRELLKEVYDFE